MRKEEVVLRKLQVAVEEINNVCDPSDRICEACANERICDAIFSARYYITYWSNEICTDVKRSL